MGKIIKKYSKTGKENKEYERKMKKVKKRLKNMVRLNILLCLLQSACGYADCEACWILL